MAKRFDERWRETQGEPFESEGELVHPRYRRSIEPGTLIEVEFLRARESPVQGLELKAKEGTLAWDAHDVAGKSVRLWADKQARATIRYATARRPVDLTIWNIWLDERHGSQPSEPERYEIVQAWRAWSGMLIDDRDDAVLLRCSGNHDGPDFADLSARITFRTG